MSSLKERKGVPLAKFAWRRLVAFSQAGASYVNKEEKMTKLKVAIQRVLNQLNELQPKMHLKFEQIAVDKALEYTEGKHKGAMMKDEQGNYMYSKAGTQEMATEQAALLDAEEEVDLVEIQPFFAKKVPNGINLALLDIFSGIVLSEEIVEEIYESYEAAEDKQEDEEKAKAEEAKPANGHSRLVLDNANQTE